MANIIAWPCLAGSTSNEPSNEIISKQKTSLSSASLYILELCLEFHFGRGNVMSDFHKWKKPRRTKTELCCKNRFEKSLIQTKQSIIKGKVRQIIFGDFYLLQMLSFDGIWISRSNRRLNHRPLCVLYNLHNW